MKILVTGATGLVGKEIVRQCIETHMSVHYLTTSKRKIENKPNYKGFYWNPEQQIIDTACFDEVDAIINLAGASISKRWTTAYKTKIINSRLQSLQLLKQSLKNNEHSVKQLISASAIGIYPNSLTNYYDESFSETSQNFLGQVAEAWETAADSFSEVSIDVAKVRIGLVLDKNEGALPQMMRPIKFGLGSAFGHGEQWQSWIHISDLAGIFITILEQELEGIYNAVAPNPITNTELTKAIAKTLHKPLFLPNIPKSVMRLVLGDMHTLLFESQRVSSKKIEKNGFNFQFSNIQPALEDLLY
ncbi:MAG: TIGR01777 family oxidoreductase [Gelidibacter sp.]|nr:TIGR01777 family oxidoreductase [Gelidibacter sp.]